MGSFIIGMAGHIDHGKTALIKAITGIETDTLKEEQERGITIDMGFAHWERQITFIDVPGHERFIRNMAAGVHAIDYALLVIAADDGIKPQTREHLDILQWLGIRQGAVVITKTDLADEALIQQRIREARQLTTGVLPADHPVFWVSALNGNGIGELISFLRTLPDQKPEKSSDQSFRMFVDRVFHKPGFGSVVTGTVRSGSLSVGSEVMLYPEMIRARVRGIQNRYQEVDRVLLGDRAAINLVVAREAHLKRGTVICEPDRFEAQGAFYAHIHFGRAVRPHATLRLLTGTEELFARIVPIQGFPWPERSGYVLLRLNDLLPLVPGDGFIIREKNASATTGGGTLIWPEESQVSALPPDKRKTVFDILLQNDRNALIRFWLNEYGYFNIPIMSRITGIRSDVLSAIALSENGIPADQAPQWICRRDYPERLQGEIMNFIDTFHRRWPDKTGIPLNHLRQHLAGTVPNALFETVLQTLKHHKQIECYGEILRRAGFISARQDHEQDIQTMLEESLKKAFYSPPGLDELMSISRLTEKEIRYHLAQLIKSGKVVHTGNQLYFHAGALAQAQSIVVDFLKKNPHITVQDFKRLTGVSRKYALAILEYFDRQQITRREADYRILNP